MKKYKYKEYYNNLNLSKRVIINNSFYCSLNEYYNDYKKISNLNRINLTYNLRRNIIIHQMYEELIQLMSDSTLNYFKTLKDFVSEYINDIKLIFKEVEQIVTSCIKLVKNDFKRILFNDYILNRSNCSDYYVDNHRHFYYTNKTNRCLIKDKKLSLINGAVYSRVQGDIVKDQIKIINLKSLYYNKDFIPSLSQVKEYIQGEYDFNVRNYFIFPLFLSGESSIFKTNHHGYISIYYQFKVYFELIMETMKECNLKETLKIIIPNTMDYNNFIKWKVVIENYYNKSNVKVKIGILIDDFDIVNYITKEVGFDFAMLDIDYVGTNNGLNTDYTCQIFNRHYLPTIREIRDILRLSNKELIIRSRKMKCSSVLTRMLVSGLNNLILNEEYFPNIDEIYKKR